MVGIGPGDVVVEEQGANVVLGGTVVGPKLVGGKRMLVVMPTGLPDGTVVLGQGPRSPPGIVQSTTTIVVVVGQGPTPPPGRGQS